MPCCPVYSQVPAFEQIEAYLVDASEGLNLSGLDECEGRFLTVSDRDDQTLYELVLDENGANLVKYSTLPKPPKLSVGYDFSHAISHLFEKLIYQDRIDWEGVSCVGNTAYLLSERRMGIYRVDSSGGHWVLPSLYRRGRDKGYFNKHNGYLEGIAVMPDKTIYGFIERNPRGVFTLRPSASGEWDIAIGDIPNTLDLPFVNDSLDVSGADVEGGYLYTLERGARSVCKRELPSLAAVACMSYQAIATGERYGYKDAVYGLAEGIAVNEHFIYVLFDNNDFVRKADVRDRRALLLRIPRPADW